MPEIRAEILVFLLAVIAGCVARLSYHCIVCFREIVRHSLLVMGIEDILYWMGAAIYFFVQIYHTSSGSIRWYFILGCVCGAIFASFLIKKIEKNGKKIYTQKKKKLSENLAGKRKKG